MKPLRASVCLCSLLFIFLAATATGLGAERPNIVFILVDDLGASDLGCYGSAFYQTPQIDRLAQDGLKFTQAYSTCTVCSPTRASFLTGRYPAALHLTDWIPGHRRPKAPLSVPAWTMQLPHDVRTLPQALHDLGYVSAAIGKWHLGGAGGPADYGFDLSVANNGLGQPRSYFSPYQNRELPDGPAGEYLTDRLETEAEQFIEAHRQKPFFLYLSHYAVHQPIAGKPEVVAKYRGLRKPGPQSNAVYAALVEGVDENLGRLRAKLAALGLTEKTIIIFTSDNGGLLGPTSNLGLRAGKGSAYEGGVRVPAIIVAPGLTKSGAVSAAPIITVDWMPTLLSLAGASPGEGMHGVDLAPLMGGADLPPRALYWHYPHYHPGGAAPYSAIRQGDWRLVAFFETGKAELYNLRDDPGEQHDLSAIDPTNTARLRADLTAWRARMGAQLPTQNPGEGGEPSAR